ncbi:OpgC domain-containing protein [Bosea sp. TND4EK4]|uniref:OpgC family protein n=1 Tax=Bosea sp. TND4EK4 TaxID=1907408 RepID=UPI000955D02F|nr:OpgC domain-containing protein [Bosea sp. TND4EK4]SIQ77883.1 hypothetical protein SAMN05880592_105225 [Bosea sp. TND4EK4]
MSVAPQFRRFILSGSAGPGAVTDKPARDARIDVIRGLCLLIIFINHMPGNVVAAYTPHNFGFSDAADIFVLLAGVSATLAYGGLIERRGLPIAMLKLGARLWTLYIAHIAVFIIVCGVIAAAVTHTQNPLYIELINVQPFFRDTAEALLGALTLTYQPSYLDILPLYIVLLALFPAIYYAVRFSPVLALGLSLAIWQGALALDLNLPNSGGTWFFNPFAWQVVFVMGVVLGRSNQLGLAAPRLRWLDALAIGFIVFSCYAKVTLSNPTGIAAFNDWFDSVQLGSDKTNLAWSRLGHVGALTWLAVRWLPAGDALSRSALGRILAKTGQNSLHVFCVGIVLAVIGQVLLAEASFDLTVQLAVCAGGVTVSAGLGVFLSWYRTVTSRAGAARAAPAPVSAAPSSSLSPR